MDIHKTEETRAGCSSPIDDTARGNGGARGKCDKSQKRKHSPHPTAIRCPEVELQRRGGGGLDATTRTSAQCSVFAVLRFECCRQERDGGSVKASGSGATEYFFFRLREKCGISGNPLSLETYAGSVIQGKFRSASTRERSIHVHAFWQGSAKGPEYVSRERDFPTPSYPRRAVPLGPGTGHPPRSSS